MKNRGLLLDVLLAIVLVLLLFWAASNIRAGAA